MKNYAIILAGGIGVRMQNTTPKCFIKLSNGKTILEQTISIFDAIDEIDELIVVGDKNYYDVKTSKSVVVVEPGQTRGQSIINAVNAIRDIDANLVIHDGARPFVSQDVVCKGLAGLREFDIVKTVEYPDKDILLINGLGTLNRTEYFFMSSPDFIKLSLFRKLNLDVLKKLSCVSQCAIKCFPDIKMSMVISNKENKKLTYPVDLLVADNYVESNAL